MKWGNSMARKATYKILMCLIILAATVTTFQNCSKSQFSNMKNDSSLTNNSNSEADTPSDQTVVDNEVITPTVNKCSFNGQIIPEGQSRQAYQNSSVPFGQNCISEERFCIKGQLEGSFNYASCSVNAPAACLFNGQTVAHQTEVTAYQQSNVEYGSSCKTISEQRKCINGQLTGSFSFASCAANSPAACLFNGQTVTHGSSITAFQNSTIAYGSGCVNESRTCNNGQLSGSFSFASCTANSPAACLFNGQTLAHGQNINAYTTSTVAYGSACKDESRACDNGVLSGTNTFASCQVDAPAMCLFNGQTIAHGASVKAYASSSVAFGSTCNVESRACNNGVLSGANTFANCQTSTPASCLKNGITVAHGEVISTFTKNSVAYNETCNATQTTCTNGQLSNSNPYTSCVVRLKPIVVNVALGVRGDCTRVSCPANAPYLVGCSIQNNGSDGRFLVQYNRTQIPKVNDIYIQEGDNCSSGGFSGNISCSTEFSANLNATSCPVYWLRTSYPNGLSQPVTTKAPVTGAIYQAL